MTKHPDLFALLAAPFDEGEVKVLSLKGRNMEYVTARTVANRLDEVCGPENWWDRYTPRENSVLCELTIRLPDGETLTKCDAGGYAGMADSGDDDKSGYSDAFKRAAVKFGIGRLLYKDGVPFFVQERTGLLGPPRPELRKVAPGGKPENGRARDQPRPADGDSAPDRKSVNREFAPPGESWRDWITITLAKANAEWMAEMVEADIDPGKVSEFRQLANEHSMVNFLCSELLRLDFITAADINQDGKPERDRTKSRAAVERFWETKNSGIRKGVKKHLAEKRRGYCKQLGMDDVAPDGGTSAPDSGPSLVEWVQLVDEEKHLNLMSHLSGFGRRRKFPERMLDWTPAQVAEGHAEGLRKLQAMLKDAERVPGRGDAYDPAEAG